MQQQVPAHGSHNCHMCAAADATAIRRVQSSASTALHLWCAAYGWVASQGLSLARPRNRNRCRVQGRPMYSGSCPHVSYYHQQPRQWACLPAPHVLYAMGFSLLLSVVCGVSDVCGPQSLGCWLVSQCQRAACLCAAALLTCMPPWLRWWPLAGSHGVGDLVLVGCLLLGARQAGQGVPTCWSLWQRVVFIKVALYL
jgi:hypothetical protein